jgi:hypothetical protein
MASKAWPRPGAAAGYQRSIPHAASCGEPPVIATSSIPHAFHEPGAVQKRAAWCKLLGVSLRSKSERAVCETISSAVTLKSSERTQNADKSLRQHRTGHGKIARATPSDFVGDAQIGHQTQHTRDLKAAQWKVKLRALL